MKTYKGILVSPGIAYGKAFLYKEEKLTIPKYEIEAGQIEKELERFHLAIDSAIAEIDDLMRNSFQSISKEEKNVLNSHILMLKDTDFHNSVKNKLIELEANVEWILLQVIEELIGKINSVEDTYLSERAVDLHDISRRVMRHLLYSERISLANLKEEIILVAHNLLPSDAISMNKKMVKGIATDMGGKTSHTAIIAKSFAIPAVLGLSNISQNVVSGDEIIIDGNKGIVIVKPDFDSRQKYKHSRIEWKKHEKKLLDLIKLPTETSDGRKIILGANIEFSEEVETAITHGADGIGLFRSEFLFMKPDHWPTEEEQIHAYKYVLEAMGNKSVTIRTLDLGGDKFIPDIDATTEDNPILGWRAVRFCLANPDIFKTQLRAILRASLYGNPKIMFPMISGIEELKKIKGLLNTVKQELSKEGIPFNQEVPVGIMIEVPSAALISDILAKEVDFFSIGTNDLIQYTIAVDRGNERIAYLYEPFHPGVLRLLKLIIDNAHAQQVPVGMCGEMAGDTMSTVVLLGLGLDEFSMSAINIPEIKQIIRSVTMAEAKELTNNIFNMSSYKEVDTHIKNWMEKKFALISY